MKQKPLIIAVIIIVVVLGLAFWYWQSTKTAPSISQTNPASPGQVSGPNAASTIPPTLGAELYQKTQNPVGNKLPQTNPFANTETNPLKQAVPNPF